jgi:hypothetical protein
VPALQQQMAQLLQQQERMAAQLQASSQQTVAGEPCCNPPIMLARLDQQMTCFVLRPQQGQVSQPGGSVSIVA